MRERRGLTRTTTILVLAAIVIVAGLSGALFFWHQPDNGPGSKPGYVDDNKLILESPGTFQWMDPHVSYNAYDGGILMHTVETLFFYNKDNATDIIPWLAESYNKSVDGLTYTIRLRKDILFQDGKLCDATAVWFSLNRLLILDGTSGDPGGPVHGSQAAWLVQQLLDPDGDYFTHMGADPAYDEEWVETVLNLDFVEIVDDHTIKINLATPSTQFLPIMAGFWCGIISPTETISADYEYHGWDFAAEQTPPNFTQYFEHMAGVGDTAFNVPERGCTFGTGPYYIERVNPTTYEVVLKAYDNYWGGPNNINLPPEGKQRIETIEYRYVEAFTTRLMNLQVGAATGIAVPTENIFSVIDRDKWIEEAELESIITGVTVHGVFPTRTTWWLSFCTNITNPDGSFRSWQPFCDWRLRMAAASSINLTDANIYINNRFGVLANTIVPPGTAPTGAYNPSIKPTSAFDLDYVEELILDAYKNPLNSTDYVMHYYNGSVIPAGAVDNAFSPTNPKTIQFFVFSGFDTFKKILVAMVDNLNAISQSAYGLKWEVVTVPGGQMLTLAGRHELDSYMGGWLADYNHVLNWLQPAYSTEGAYPLYNQWNIPALNDLYLEAVAADKAGDEAELLRINDEMNTLANEMVMYMVWWHPTLYFIRSSWLQGWYFNPAISAENWAPMYYERP